MKLPSTGESDCHRIEQVGSAVTEFCNPIMTMDNMIREKKREIAEEYKSNRWA
ncbi:MAG: hypothetical protein JRI72_08980 [Deltaproteobacteria bacterium]|nr:hypothetical protein [Deltaproteobacteria bacterium]